MSFFKDDESKAWERKLMSFFKDDESKAWERKLMAPDLGLDAAALQMSKETRSFLWKAGTVPYVSAVQLTHVLPDNPSAEADLEDSSFNQSVRKPQLPSFRQPCFEQDFQAQRGLEYP